MAEPASNLGGGIVDIGLNTLLVALMFVTVLCMGIGNILVVMADISNQASPSRRDRVHVAWIVLLLLIHFNLFWHTKAILTVDDWRFPSFLLAIAGPVLLFFATSIALTELPARDAAGAREFFDALGRRFFMMLAALQVWIVGVSYSLDGSFVASDMINAGLFGLALVLSTNPRAPFQVPGVFVAWGLGLVSLGLRWLEASN